MKIRIHNDSIRLRLDRSEVADIGEGNPVECSTRFAGGTQFRYSLRVGDHNAVGAIFTERGIELSVPRDTAEHWAKDEMQVSIRGNEDVDGGELALLIEKDFECLEPRPGESQSNRFINPKSAGAAQSD